MHIPVERAFGLVIHDAGNAWNSPWENNGGSFSLSDLTTPWGLGVRVKTPLGNFRLDHATGERESKTHFGFGEMFRKRGFGRVSLWGAI